MKYEIVIGGSPEELESVVNEMIKDGWEPVGGCIQYHPAVKGFMNSGLIADRMAQAMVKRG